MKPVLIITVPHETQRYPTVGDYNETDMALTVRVSQMDDWRSEFCVALHELVEQALTKKRGIKEADIDAFDRAFEDARQPGDDSEPGAHPEAPYHWEHRFAESIERAVAIELGLAWSDHENRVAAL
jgi:hypothetical protein